MTKSRPLILLALPLVAATALAACGSDSAGSSTSDGLTDSTPTDSVEANVPTSSSADSAGLDGREFVSTQVDGYEVVPDSVIRISFEDGSVSINAGCNTMFGAYTVDGRRAQRTDARHDPDGVRPGAHGAGHMDLHADLGRSDRSRSTATP